MIYTPAEDSLLLEQVVFSRAKGKKVLDIGAGSGIQALAAIKAGAKSVIAADINNDAVIIMKRNGINALQSDLFDKVKGKFDLIVCNPPYLPEDEREDSESSLITSGGKRGDEFIIRFLTQAASHLNDNGEILLVTSSLTPRDNIDRLLEQLKMKKTVLKTRPMSLEKLEVWSVVQ